MGFNYDADVVIICHKEHRFNYSFNLRGQEGARLASSDLSARKGENPVLGLEKLNSPQA
jgi:hypothetical protein